MANEALISVGLDHLDDGPISYCVDRLMADGPWDENSTPVSTATTLRLHLRAIPDARIALDQEDSA